MSEQQTQSSRRLDKWLWCARQFKTRSLAARFVEEKTVRLTRAGVTERIDKPSRLLNRGDEIAFMLGDRLVILAVEGFAMRRGPASQAQKLYRSLAPGPAERACAGAR